MSTRAHTSHQNKSPANSTHLDLPRGCNCSWCTTAPSSCQPELTPATKTSHPPTLHTSTSRGAATAACAPLHLVHVNQSSHQPAKQVTRQLYTPRPPAGLQLQLVHHCT